jgi:hypothetical protein
VSASARVSAASDGNANMLTTMPTSRHTAEQIAAFSDGETRFIAAAYRDPSRGRELFVIADGMADQLREFTRAQLRCLISECESPDIVAVARAHRRDGFSHKSGGGRHFPETVNHLQGKAVLAAWLRDRVPRDAVVTVEAAIDTQRTRVADVLVTFPAGERLAFEVQYAAITVEEWRARHESYRAAGVVDVWLWGHTRMRRSRSSWDPPYRLDDVQDEARRRGLPVHWICPHTGEIATAVTYVENDPLEPQDRFGDVVLQRLSACGVTPAGIQSGLLRAIKAQTVRWQEALERQRLEKEREHEEWLQRLRRESTENRERSLQLRQGSEQGHASRPQRGSGKTATYPRCRACGLPLDPIAWERGVHFGRCEERLTFHRQMPGTDG